jgi:hypothetical protein
MIPRESESGQRVDGSPRCRPCGLGAEADPSGRSRRCSCTRRHTASWSSREERRRTSTATVPNQRRRGVAGEPICSPATHTRSSSLVAAGPTKGIAAECLITVRHSRTNFRAPCGTLTASPGGIIPRARLTGGGAARRCRQVTDLAHYARAEGPGRTDYPPLYRAG